MTIDSFNKSSNIIRQTTDRLHGETPIHLVQAALSRLVREGRDPTHGGAAARHRAESLARRRQKAAEWERTNRRPDPAEFTQTILPGLQDVPLSRMVEVTGLTVRYCSLIRRGLYVPHPRHWEALKSVAALEENLNAGKIPETAEA